VARYDRQIPPGGEGSITVRIKTKGYQGNIRKRARILTNDPRKKVEMVEIKAFVRAPIYLAPRFVYLRGLAGRKLSKTVSVRAGEERFLTLEEASFNLGARVAYSIEEVEKGRFFKIHFTAIPGPPGNYRGVLRLKTNYPERPQIAIPIVARVYDLDKARKGRGNKER
jgi:hypothetical protein